MASSTLSIHSNCRAAPFPVQEFIMKNDDCNILSAQAKDCTIQPKQRDLNKETPSSSKSKQPEY